MRIDPLTALKFVSISRSFTDICPFVLDTISSSFSGGFWTQIVVKKFAQPELMLTSESVFVNLSFQCTSRRQEKRPDDIVRNQPAKKGIDSSACSASWKTTR